ncbi:hypothetical protein [Thiorhodococcus minor]|uniref:Uncharacterized protein n=1 Tax=Thiorhodococcus minor TaxID=57489 RepID=A0A6M0K7C3_9GAMM|nr:hypothetical protein [Thiorhodococcus minor]NEV65261.1 hypothetical protein [Thiorhodococcus minor]
MPDLPNPIKGSDFDFRPFFTAAVEKYGLRGALDFLPKNDRRRFLLALKDSPNLWNPEARKKDCAEAYASVLSQLFPTNHTLH